MTTHITAIYENGVLRPTKPLPLRDGERIDFTVDFERRRSADSHWLLELESLSQLKDGWNGYTAPRPLPIALSNAKTMLNEALNRNILPERIEPSAMGGIGITFANEDLEVVAEFYNNGTVHALFADNSVEQMETRPVAPTIEGYQVFLDEVCRYLHAQPTAK